MKKLIVLALLLPSLCNTVFAGDLRALKIDAAAKKLAVEPLKEQSVEVIELLDESLMAPRDLGPLKVLQSEKSFLVVHEDGTSVVPASNLSSDLRLMDGEGLKSFLNEDGYIKVNRRANGEFTLDSQYRLRGGGVLGAYLGAATGKFIVHLVFHGTAAVVSTVVGVVATPAAGVAVFGAIEKTFAIPVELLSNTIAVGCGIAGGAITGPV